MQICIKVYALLRHNRCKGLCEMASIAPEYPLALRATVSSAHGTTESLPGLALRAY